MKKLALLVASLIVSFPALAEPALTNFPGNAKSLRAPGSAMRLVYSVTRRGIPWLMLDNGRGKRVRLLEIQRNVDVAWAPDKRRFFVNDNSGSDVADCVVMRPGVGGVTKVSLTRITGRLRGHPSGNEAPGGSHYYVVCERWLSNTVISGRIDGHTDDPNDLHDFDYPFVYDSLTGRAAWRPKETRR